MFLSINTGCYKPKIIAHRGYWKSVENAQNSIAGIRAADHYKFYASEFDVRLTQDSIPIVFHDHEIKGMEIEKTDFENLKNIKLPNGESIPTLDEFLTACKTLHNIRLIAELKPQTTLKLEEYLVSETLNLLEQHQLIKQTDFISFSAHICDELKLKMSSAHVQYLKGDFSPAQIKERGWDGLDYHYKILLKNKLWVKEAQELGLSTNAWTINSKETFKALKNLKIEMLTTDEPLKFKNL